MSIASTNSYLKQSDSNCRQRLLISRRCSSQHSASNEISKASLEPGFRELVEAVIWCFLQFFRWREKVNECFNLHAKQRTEENGAGVLQDNEKVGKGRCCCCCCCCCGCLEKLNQNLEVLCNVCFESSSESFFCGTFCQL